MTRLAIGALIGLAIGLTVGAALQSHAESEPTEDTLAAAIEAGVDALQLQGALNATHMDAHAYLCAADGLLCPVLPPVMLHGQPAQVRLTYYVLGGVTYSGGRPYLGSTACSWNFRIGQRFVFRDGESVVCNDRGLLGSTGWLDVWGQAALVRKYGAFASVQVVP